MYRDRLRGRLPLLLLVLAHLAAATAYNAAVPVFEAPDEPQHYFFAQLLARERRLPVQSLLEWERGPWEQEGSQPPLFYVLAAPLVALSGDALEAADLLYNHQNTMGNPALEGNENRFVHPQDRERWPWRGYVLGVHLVRGLSTVLGALTVVCVWLVARHVFRVAGGGKADPAPDAMVRATAVPAARAAPAVDRPVWLPLAAAAIVAFNPQFLAMSATVSNDGLIVLLSTATLALLLRVADGSDDARTLATLAVLVGLAPLAKLSGLALSGFALASIGALAWRRRDRRLLVAGGGAMVAAMLLLAGWWFARNQQLYGDPTGLSHMLPPSLRRDFLWARWLRGLPGEWKGLWFSSWGLFGWFTVMLPMWVYAAISAAALAAAGGLLLAARRRAPWISWRRLVWLVAWFAVAIALLLRWTTYAKGAHGRLSFPAIAVVAIVLVAGWRGLAPRRLSDRGLALTIAGATCALAIAALAFVIRPAYAWPSSLPRAEIPSSAVPAGVVFDDRMELVAAEVPPRAEEGSSVPVTMYWAPHGDVDRDGAVVLRLDQQYAAPPDAVRTDVLETLPGTPQLAYPGAGAAPFALWSGAYDLAADAVVADSRRLRVPALVDADTGAGSPHAGRLPVVGRLSVHIYDPETSKTWPAVHPSGEPAPDWSAAIAIDPRHPLDLEDLPRLELVGRSPAGIDLLLQPDDNGEVPGAEHGEPPAERGQDRATEVVWLARDVPTEELTAFVHLVDADGNVVATFDRPPATHGPYPTQLWRLDRPVPASLSWRVPDDARPGEYRLLLGLYRAPEGSRVPLLRADGSEWPERAAVVWQGIVE